MGDALIAGDWWVKAGEEEEFVARWLAFTGWARENAAGAKGFILLRDREEPRHFVSIGTWTDRSAVQVWRSGHEFAAGLSRCRELCDEFRGSDYEVAAEPAPVA